MILISASSRNAKGTGTIRKKITLKGNIVWEARVTIGIDPITGKQKQKSISGKSQKEVRQRMQAILVEVNDHTYHEPSKMLLKDWLDE